MTSGGKALSGQGKVSAYGSAGTDPVLLAAQIGAMLAVGAGVIHFSAAGDHTDLPVMFGGFLAVAILQVALGALLLRRPPSRPLLVAAVIMMISSIGLWLLSRTAGLPLLPNGHVEPVGFKDGVTKLFEIASIPVLLLLMSPELARVSMPSPRLPTQALGLVGLVCLALMPPALLLDGGHQHSHEQAVALGLHDDAHHGGEQLAHAGPGSAHSRGDHGNSKSAHESHSSSGHGHTPGATGAHGHSAASAPLGASHHHSVAPAPGGEPHQHSDESGGNHGGGNHHPGGDRHPAGDHHRDRPGGKHHGGDHGSGHGDGHGDAPSNDPAITVSYAPEPSICIGGEVCLP